MVAEQLLLDLDPQEADLAEDEIDQQSSLRPRDLRRAVMAWLVGKEATGLGTKVATRIYRYRADVAAFWNDTKRNPADEGPSRILMPTRTIIIECRARREDCWPDVHDSATLLPQLRHLKRKRNEMEAQIRDEEPQLLRADGLFPEYHDWEYEKSENEAYQDLRRDVKRLEKTIYEGSRFEAIHDAELADFLYLAVPARTVHPHEVADGWGLLWINSDLRAQLVSEAEDNQCQDRNRMHLVQNIAAASTDSVLFANGLYDTDGEIQFLPVPRRRRPSAKKKSKRQSS